MRRQLSPAADKPVHPPWAGVGQLRTSLTDVRRQNIWGSCRCDRQALAVRLRSYRLGPGEVSVGSVACLSFDLFSFKQDGLTSAEVDVGRGEIGDALVVRPVRRSVRAQPSKLF